MKYEINKSFSACQFFINFFFLLLDKSSDNESDIEPQNSANNFKSHLAS